VQLFRKQKARKLCTLEARKRIPSNLGGQFATLGANVQAFINILMCVLTFINNLGPICKPKMLKVGPKLFWALTPSVK